MEMRKDIRPLTFSNFIATMGCHIIVLIKVNVNLVGVLAKFFVHKCVNLLFNKETLVSDKRCKSVAKTNLLGMHIDKSLMKLSTILQ